MSDRWEPKPRGVGEHVLWLLTRHRDYRDRVETLLRTRGQTSFVYCPHCGSELSANPVTKCTDTDLVRYQCGHCHQHSTWNFDVPAPLLVDAKRAER